MQQEPIIPRTNHLRGIATTLKSGVDVIFVDGPPGVGVTTLLHQLAAEETPTVALFLRNGTRIGYDPRLVLCRLVNGLATAMGDAQISETHEQAMGNLPTLLNKLDRRAIHRFFVTFIIDGLHQIPATDTILKQEIIDLLPIGQPGCKFVIGGSPGEFGQKSLRRLKTATHTVPGFTLDEARTFLSDYSAVSPMVERIWNDAGCNPSVLASVRRFLDAGTLPEDLAQRLSDDPQTVFMSEWQSVDMSELAKLVLAITAFDDGEYSLSELAEIAERSNAEVAAALGKLRFMTVPEEGAVQFISPFFREFARKQLGEIRTAALDRVIKRYIAVPDSDRSLSSLPRYLSERGRGADLLEYLAAERFPALVKAAGSVAIVHQAAASAIGAARELKRYDEIVRFSVHAATLANIHASQPPDSEVRALLALDRFEEARFVAESASVAEERLQLLAQVGRDLAERGMAPDARLVQLIEDLYTEIDLSIFGGRGMQLAEDLLFVCPALGLELLDKLAQARRNDEGSSWAFADLAVQAAKWSKKEVFPSTTVASLHAHIVDPEAKLTAACRAAAYAKSSGEEILAEAQRLQRVGDKLRLIGSWAAANRSHRDVLKVVTSALAWMTSTLEYTPDVRILRQLASALPGRSEPKLAEIVASFDALKGIGQTIGPSSEYVRLQGALAHAEWGYNRQDASNRLMTTALFTAELADPASRALGFAALGARLSTMDPEHRLDISDGLHQMALTETMRAVEETLKSTAEPHLTLAGVLRSLARTNVDLAIGIAERYNSVERTDTGLFQLAFAMGSGEFALPDIDKVVGRISSVELRELALLVPLMIWSEAETLTAGQLSHASEVLSSMCRDKIHVRTLARGVPIAVKHGLAEKDLLLASIAEWVSAAERTSRTVETAFELSAMLASAVPQTSRELFEHARALRRELVLPNELKAETYELCVSLASKALRSLFRGSRETEQNMYDIGALIAELPARGSRLRQWADLATGFAEAGRLDRCRELRDGKIQPILQDAKVASEREYASAIIEASPVLFRCHSASTIEILKSLAPQDRDRAILAIGHQVRSGLPHHEPCSAPLDGIYDLTYEEVVDLLGIAELVEQDSACFQLLRCVCTSMTSDKHRTYSREQKAQVASRVRQISASKFPAPRYVSHNGYGIVARAQALQLVQTSAREWEDLAKEARAVDNTADVPLVLMLIATCTPSKHSAIKATLLLEAQERIEKLSSLHDRLQRKLDLANSLRSTDRGTARTAVKEALAIFRASPELTLPATRLVDAIHRIDPEAGTLLVAVTDDDPARAAFRQRLRKELDVRKLSQTIGGSEPNDVRNEVAGEAAWLALAELNANQGTPLPADDIWRLVEKAASRPLHESFPLLSLAFASAGRRFSGTEQSASVLRAVFDGSLAAARVVLRLSSEVAEPSAALAKGARESSVLIRVGERTRANAWLESWCTRHVADDIVVCDPYFSLRDLECVKLIAAACPAARIRVVTSRIALAQVGQPWEQSFRDYWSQSVAGVVPPETEVLVVGVGPQGKSPIHDRWWLASKKGIRLGTSFNGLGSRESELSELDDAQFGEVRELLDFYLRRERRVSRDQRVEYSMFSL